MNISACKFILSTSICTNKSELYALIGLIFVYLVSRLNRLTAIPIYLDEALHIQRAIAAQHGSLWIGAEKGKWLGTLMFVPFIGSFDDPLWAARFSSVLYGIITLLVCYLIGQTLFSKKVGLLAALLYVSLPFIFFYNRLALVDGSLALYAGWIIFFSIKVVRYPTNLRYSLLLALTIIAAILTKVSGAVFLAVPIAAALLLASSSESRKSLLNIMPSILAGLATLWFIYEYNLGVGEAEAKLGNVSLQLFVRNIVLLANWLWTLVTPPLTLLLLLMISLVLKPGSFREEKFLLAVFLLIVPFLVKVEVFYPRYILFISLPICLIIANGLAYIEKFVNRVAPAAHSAVFGGIIASLLVWSVHTNAALVTDPVSARLPPIIKNVYLGSFLSGYGIAEAGTYLDTLAESAADGINLIRLDCWDHVNNSLPFYLFTLGKIHFVTFHPGDTPTKIAKLRRELAELINRRRTVFVHSHPPLCYSDHIIDVMLLHVEGQKVWSTANPHGEQKIEIWELQGIRQTP